MSDLPRYRASGRTSFWFLPIGLVCVAIGMALEWPYQALVTWVPYIYINAIVYLVFAVGLGVLAGVASNLGKNRNRWLGALLGLVVACSAVGASHYFAYRSAVSDVREELERHVAAGEIDNVDGVMPTFGEFIKLRTESGWSLGRRGGAGKGNITGVVVWLIWGIEALGLLGVSIYFGMRMSPFCEQCNTPLDEEDLFVRRDLHLGDIGAIKEAQTVADIISIPPRPDVSGIEVKFASHVCKTCSGDAYLTVTQSWTEGTEDKSEELHTDVVMTRAEREQLIALGAQLAQYS